MPRPCSTSRPACSPPSGCPRRTPRSWPSNLIGANLRGHDSHGVLRIPQYIDFLRKGDYQVGVDLKVENESPGVVVVDGQWGLGQVQAHRLLDLVIPKAKELGLAAGTGRNFGHIGRLGEYAERAADEGLILIATVNNNGAGQRVAPPGGLEPRLGHQPPLRRPCRPTPTPSCSTSAPASRPRGRSASTTSTTGSPSPRAGCSTPKGQPTTDPSVLYEPPLGSILPMGGTQAYKGFGLGLVLDMLSGGLTGGKSSHPGAAGAKGNNVVFLALDPERFAGLGRPGRAVRRPGPLRPGHAQGRRGRRDPPARRPRADDARIPIGRGNPARGRPLGQAHRTGRVARGGRAPAPPAEPVRDPSKVDRKGEPGGSRGHRDLPIATRGPARHGRGSGAAEGSSVDSGSSAMPSSLILR